MLLLDSSVSFTVTSKLQVAVFPAASVTSNVLVVVPTGNVLPLGSPASLSSVDSCTIICSNWCSISTTAEQSPRVITCRNICRTCYCWIFRIVNRYIKTTSGCVSSSICYNKRVGCCSYSGMSSPLGSPAV